jgi:hypothetical protein
MKKILLAAFGMCAFGPIAFSQIVETSTIPPQVVSALNTSYKNPAGVKWELDYDNYLAKFEADKVETVVTYNKEGKWLKTETPVSYKTVPAVVKEALSKQFDNYKELDVEKVEKPEGISYLINLEHKQLFYEVLISDKGEIIRNDEVKEHRKE